MNKRKKLPISISTFSNLINGNYIYVDKTQYIYRIVNQGGAFFLSRPRRFGKSLLVSTLKEIFLGNKELFKDCWIYDKIAWETYTVLHMDFSEVFSQATGIYQALTDMLHRQARENAVQIEGNSIPGLFLDLIQKLSKNKPIVILIDEYDKPITDYLDNPEKAEEHRSVLKPFFGLLKSQERNIRFLFMTGVSRFSRLSVFSDLNHLADISFHRDFMKLLGYTSEEIEFYFADYIEEYSTTVPDYSRETFFAKLKDFYNGYSWDGETFVYNPVSITHFFYEYQFNHFWFATGTPSMLIKMARLKGLDVRSLESFVVNKSFFDTFDISNIDLDLLLFQTGYLTVKRREEQRFYLSYPNREVEDAFINNLLQEFSGQAPKFFEDFSPVIQDALFTNNIPLLIEQMKTFLAAIPYNLVTSDAEKYYHLVFYLVLKTAMGKVSPVHPTSRGRIDMVVKTDLYIYIIEFKLGNGEKALQQIKDKRYYEQYLGKGKKVILLGIGFSPELRNIDDYTQEEANTISA